MKSLFILLVVSFLSVSVVKAQNSFNECKEYYANKETMAAKIGEGIYGDVEVKMLNDNKDAFVRVTLLGEEVFFGKQEKINLRAGGEIVSPEIYTTSNKNFQVLVISVTDNDGMANSSKNHNNTYLVLGNTTTGEIFHSKADSFHSIRNYINGYFDKIFLSEQGDVMVHQFEEGILLSQGASGFKIIDSEMFTTFHITNEGIEESSWENTTPRK